MFSEKTCMLRAAARKNPEASSTLGFCAWHFIGLRHHLSRVMSNLKLSCE